MSANPGAMTSMGTDGGPNHAHMTALSGQMTAEKGRKDLECTAEIKFVLHFSESVGQKASLIAWIKITDLLGKPAYEF